MKKMFCILLTVLFMLVFVSCGGNNDENNDGNDEENNQVSDQEESADNDTNDAEAVNDDESVNDGEISDNSNDSELELKYKEADEHAGNVSADIVKANSDLALQMFSTLSLEESGVNMMISPLSISIAMSMVLNGASDSNLDEMKEVLGFHDISMEDINAQFHELIQSLVGADKDMTLSIADSVWMDTQFEPYVKEAFLNALTENYDAEPFTIDFAGDTAVDQINSWVYDNTNGKIDKIIEKIGPDAVMYLINAIYFNAAWTVSFDKDSTYEGEFQTTTAENKTVEMMTFKDSQEFEFYTSGYEDGSYSVVRLPYGRGKFAFYGIMPNGGETIDQFIVEMTQNGLDSYLDNLQEQEVPVILPKFKFKYGKSLVDMFKNFGMDEAFVPGGFLNLADEGDGLYISEIMHKTFIEVNEEGTEAAAVTSVEVGNIAIPDGFYGTRPFVFVIRDDRSGTILFMGKVEDPTQE